MVFSAKGTYQCLNFTWWNKIFNIFKLTVYYWIDVVVHFHLGENEIKQMWKNVLISLYIAHWYVGEEEFCNVHIKFQKLCHYGLAFFD